MSSRDSLERCAEAVVEAIPATPRLEARGSQQPKILPGQVRGAQMSKFIRKVSNAPASKRPTGPASPAWGSKGLADMTTSPASSRWLLGMVLATARGSRMLISCAGGSSLAKTGRPDGTAAGTDRPARERRGLSQRAARLHGGGAGRSRVGQAPARGASRPRFDAPTGFGRSQPRSRSSSSLPLAPPCSRLLSSSSRRHLWRC